MALEEALRNFVITMLSNLKLPLSNEEINELIDIVKFSDNPEEIEKCAEKIAESLKEKEEKKLMDIALEIINSFCEILSIDPLEIKTPRTLDEAFKELADMAERARESFKCTKKEQIERIREYIKELIEHIGDRYPSPDSRIIVEATLDKLDEDTEAIFNPETYKRIQDLIIEREKILALERAKIREKLKLVAKSLVDTLNSLDTSEDNIINSLNEHVADIEDVLKLESLEEITERLTKLSGRLKQTILNVKRELSRSKAEIQKSKQSVERLKAGKIRGRGVPSNTHKHRCEICQSSGRKVEIRC